MDIQAFYGTYIEPYIFRIALAVVIFVVGWILSKWANRATRGLCRRYDPALSGFLGGMAQWTVLLIAFITAISKVGVQTTSLVAVLASAGLAVGLALQGNLANFASGVMLLIFRPFNLEHRVTAAGETGVVKDIGIFATTLVTPDNVKIILPNSSITSNAILNYTAQGRYRAAIDVGVAYGSNVDQVIEVLTKAASRIEKVLDDPAPSVFFAGLGASSLDFRVLAWCLPPDAIAVQNAVRTAVYDDLNAADIEIPFAQMVLHKAPAE